MQYLALLMQVFIFRTGIIYFGASTIFFRASMIFFGIISVANKNRYIAVCFMDITCLTSFVTSCVMYFAC